VQRAIEQLDDDDAALMAGVVARDHQAFEQIVHIHSKPVFRIAYRMLNNGPAAEDVAQDALLRLWNNASQWRNEGPGIGAWLRRVATNLCLDQLRKRKFSSDAEVPETADSAPLADREIEQGQMRAAIMKALAQLNERQRAAIVLTYYEAMSNASAAEVLEMNVKAFESLLLRARQTLKAALSTADVELDDVRDQS
jgi:RNA polymerase sigma factor (sigma-70 family)